MSSKARTTRSWVKLVKLEEEIAVLESKLKGLMEKARDKEERKAVAEIVKNPNYFYGYARRFSRNTLQVGPLLSDGEAVNGDLEMAEILVKQYSSVLRNPRYPVNSEFVDSLVNSDVSDGDLDELVIDEHDIREAIKELSNQSASGPDGLSPVLLKNGGARIVSELVEILRMSLDQGKFPGNLKHPWICPLWKGESRAVAANYRPVSLVSNLSKVLEKVVRSKIVKYLEDRGLMDQMQHGARNGRSTLTQLIQQHELIMDILEDGEAAEVIYLDFSKAFDTCDHSVILEKIRAVGIGGKVLRWLADFLSERSQAVRVGDCLSSWRKVTSGVPQGSVLGPLLFLLYISDLAKDIDLHCNDAEKRIHGILKFVDDTKIIASVRNDEDISNLQDELLPIYEWSMVNNMSWNDGKFKELRIGPQRNCDGLLFTPGFEEVMVPEANVKDLGVLIDCGLNFKDQRLSVLKKTKNKASWVLRTFKSRELDVLRRVWMSLVQPHMDYGCILWYPVEEVCEIKCMESVLKSFSKYGKGLRNLSYNDRLKCLGLSSQERRVERYKILYMRKMICGVVPNVGCSIKEDSRYGPILDLMRGNKGADSVKTVRDRSLLVEGCRLYNAVPRRIREYYGDFLGFKNCIDIWLNNVPDHPRELGNEPIARDREGRPSNSLKYWMKTEELLNYDDSWVPKKPVKPSDLIEGE